MAISSAPIAANALCGILETGSAFRAIIFRMSGGCVLGGTNPLVRHSVASLRITASGGFVLGNNGPMQYSYFNQNGNGFTKTELDYSPITCTPTTKSLTLTEV
jgi:hypothetical protein